MSSARIIRPWVVILCLMIFQADWVLLANHEVVTLTVNTTADEIDGRCEISHCSLREAVIAANHSDTFSVIVVPAGTYLLTRRALAESPDEEVDDLDITRDMHIIGAGVDQTILSGGHVNRVIDINLTDFEIGNHYSMQVSYLTIRDGRTKEDGGGVRAQISQGYSPIKFDNCRITANTVAPEINRTSNGGGLYASHNFFFLYRCEIDHNQVLDNGLGGGIAYGESPSGYLNIRQTSIHENTAPIGAGIAIWEDSPLSSGSVSLIQSAVYANDGHGIWGSNAYVRFYHSTISSNNNAAIDLTYTTSLEQTPENLFRYLTIAENNGPPIRVTVDREEYIQISVLHSLIARNRSVNGNLNDCFDFDKNVFASIGLNLLEYAGNCEENALITGKDPLIMPLADNGGMTLTHALAPNSPAIDVVACDLAEIPPMNIDNAPIDQREAYRVLGACDLGAYEYSPEPPVISDQTIEAPSELIVNQVEQGFQLTWQDNSTNETDFWILVDGSERPRFPFAKVMENETSYLLPLPWSEEDKEPCTLTFAVAGHQLGDRRDLNDIRSTWSNSVTWMNDNPDCQIIDQ